MGLRKGDLCWGIWGRIGSDDKAHVEMWGMLGIKEDEHGIREYFPRKTIDIECGTFREGKELAYDRVMGTRKGQGDQGEKFYYWICCYLFIIVWHVYDSKSE